MVFAKVFLWGVCLLLSAAVSVALAAPGNGFYQVVLPVDDLSSKQRRAAFNQAMAQLMVRISGTRAVLKEPAAQPLLKKADTYVRQYSYLEPAEPALEDITPEDIDFTASDQQQQMELAQPAAPVLQIVIDFSGQALERAMHSAGLQVWGADRPATLVWVGVQTGEQRLLLSEDSDHPIKQQLEDFAAERGIPLSWPLFDLDDRRAVTFTDLRAGFIETILSASQRYAAAAVIAGFLEQNRSDDWSGRWILHLDGAEYRWQNDAAPLDELAHTAIDGVADTMAVQYAFMANPDRPLSAYVVAVDRVLGVEQYATVLNYLRSLLFVEDVSPVRVESGQVRYRVLMRGEISDLRKALSVSKVLNAETVGFQHLPQLLEWRDPSLPQSLRDRVDLRYNYVGS